MSVFFGAIFAFLSVLAGAFAAHGLKEHLSAYGLGIWQTAVQYQMYHALALILLGLLERGKTELRLARWSFVIGILLFSGSLYVLALTEIKVLGMITPFGGVLFLVGWGSFAKFAWKNR